MLVGVTFWSGFQPPVLDLSCAGTGQCSVEVESAGPSGISGWFAVGEVERIAIEAEVIVLQD